MESDLVFVYGTLRPAARSDIHDRYLGNRADLIGLGTVAGKLWRVSWYPALTLGTSLEDRVFGEIYRLRKPDKMLAELDRFEVCDLSRPEESEYTREIVEVRRADEAPVSAWCYRYLGSVAGLTRIISGDFAGESG
jgi:gamma-glutamylcyclotransferase (GGCT)/AIG2-like uncharacterized protein YtfP